MEESDVSLYHIPGCSSNMDAIKEDQQNYDVTTP